MTRPGPLGRRRAPSSSSTSSSSTMASGGIRRSGISAPGPSSDGWITKHRQLNPGVYEIGASPVVVAAGIGLEADAERFPLLAESVEGRARGLRSEERPVEAEAALKNRRRPDEPAAGEPRGDDAGVGGPSRVHPLHPRAVLQVLDHARREAARDAERRRQSA